MFFVACGVPISLSTETEAKVAKVKLGQQGTTRQSKDVSRAASKDVSRGVSMVSSSMCF